MGYKRSIDCLRERVDQVTYHHERERATLNQSNSMVKPHLPFKVGQYAEAKCFSKGFRGAWFRSKITNIIGTDESMKLYLEYYDFPDEKMEWKKLYSKRNRYNTKEHLMVRPPYPPVYCEGDLLDITNDSEVMVVVNDVWKEGDLVDWWTDGCYWSGKLTKKLTKETFQIELWPEPEGEGSSYEADCKDLRPSLVWSPELGWTLPFPEGCKSVSPCARLVHPKVHQVHSVDEGGTVNPVTTEVREEHRPSKSSTSKEGCSGRFLTDHSRGMAGNCDGKDHRINECPSKLPRIHPVDEGRKSNPVPTEVQEEHKPLKSSTSDECCSGRFLTDQSRGMAGNCDGKDHHINEGTSKLPRIHPVDEGNKGNPVIIEVRDEHRPSKSSTREVACHSGRFLTDQSRGMAGNCDGKDHRINEGPSKLPRRTVPVHPVDEGRTDNQVAQPENKPSSSGTSKGGCPGNFLKEPEGGMASHHDGEDHHLVDEPSWNRATSEGITSNSTHSDTIDASILELEELLGRVKWIKSILQGGSNSPKWTYTPK